jgi:NADH:ubiquinone oxidoreductase subunit C
MSAETQTPANKNHIVSILASTFGQKVQVEQLRPNRIKVMLQPDDIVEVATFVRDSLHFDHCANVSGTDFPKDKQIRIDYHLGSIDGEGLRSMILDLSYRVPSDDPRPPSLIAVYPSAELHERETAEMLGVSFRGHPDLSKLFLPEDWDDIPPMLKAFRLPGRLEGE